MILKEGSGWRLEKDISRDSFPILIGGEYWALELSYSEWISLYPVLKKLLDQYEKISATLMKEEEIFIEIEISPWWACIDGKIDNWCLKLIYSGEFVGGRSFEVVWPYLAAKEVTSMMRIMWDSQ